MRLTTTAAAGAALALLVSAGAHAQSAQPQPGAAQPQAAQPQAQQPAGQAQRPTVRSINIVDFSELPPETKTQVDSAARKATDEDLKGLRTAIDKSPEITKALTAKGAKSTDVIVANLDQQGLLTLVTKKRA